jgi:hypothetical protein
LPFCYFIMIAVLEQTSTLIRKYKYWSLHIKIHSSTKGIIIVNFLRFDHFSETSKVYQTLLTLDFTILDVSLITKDVCLTTHLEGSLLELSRFMVLLWLEHCICQIINCDLKGHEWWQECNQSMHHHRCLLLRYSWDVQRKVSKRRKICSSVVDMLNEVLMHSFCCNFIII